jgi:4-amino-4-deoxy-L-arabinose transferase-like glycosyltransferase
MSLRSRDGEPATGRSGDRRVTSTAGVRNRLVAATAALFFARVVLSLARSGPVLVADEIGYLANARVIAGGVAGQLEQAPFYRAGYSLLIAPLIDLSSNPTTAYHLILVLNAALAASIFPLLYLLLTRFAGVRPRLAIWAALAGAVYPAVTVLSQAAMSENALFPLTCAWLLAFGGLLAARDRRGELLWATALGASTGALWAVHNRMIVAVAIAAVGLLWMAARRRLHPAALALGLGVLAAAFLGTHLLDNFVIDHNYGGSPSDELSERTDSLLHFGGLRTVTANLIGQTWYLLVASFGLAGAALADFVARRRRGGAEERPAPVLGILLALTALLLLVSAAAFPERSRPDMLIYGRYTEIAAPALVAFGVVALARARIARPLAWPLLGFALLTGAVALIRATASDPDAANRWNISALPFVTVQLGPAILVGAALVAAGGAWLLLRSSVLGPRALGSVAVGLFLAVIAYGVWNPVRSSQRAVYPAGWTSPQPVAEAAGASTIAYDLDAYDTIGLYVTQWFLPDSHLLLFEDGSQRPPSRYVISGGAWGREHRGAAKLLWRDPGRDQGLWRIGR